MSQPFTPEQSREIDDRLVEMMVAVMGEGEYARRCRAIANARAEENPVALTYPGWQPIETAPTGELVLGYCPSANDAAWWPNAPWIIVKHVDGEWLGEKDWPVEPTHWMPLTAPGDAPNVAALTPEQEARAREIAIDVAEKVLGDYDETVGTVTPARLRPQGECRQDPAAPASDAGASRSGEGTFAPSAPGRAAGTNPDAPR